MSLISFDGGSAFRFIGRSVYCTSRLFIVLCVSSPETVFRPQGGNRKTSGCVMKNSVYRCIFSFEANLPLRGNHLIPGMQMFRKKMQRKRGEDGDASRRLMAHRDAVSGATGAGHRGSPAFRLKNGRMAIKKHVNGRLSVCVPGSSLVPRRRAIRNTRCLPAG